MEDHIQIRSDRSLLLGRQTSKLSLWDVDFHENNSIVFLDKSLQQTNKVSSINDILKMDENVKARLQSKITLS